MAYGFNDDKSKVGVVTNSDFMIDNYISIPTTSIYRDLRYYISIDNYTFPSDGYLRTYPQSDTIETTAGCNPFLNIDGVSGILSPFIIKDSKLTFYLMYVRKGMVLNGEVGEFTNSMAITRFDLRFYPIISR